MSELVEPQQSPSPSGAGVLWGLDVGTARVGLARSDAAGILASPVETVPTTPEDRSSALERVLELVRAEPGTVGVFVGLPRHLDGHESSSAALARHWARDLARALGVGVEVRLVDERMSTVVASRAMRSAGVAAAQQRDRIDQAAAVAILQTVLDARASGTLPGERVTGRKSRHRRSAQPTHPGENA
ncbi:putative holliday junction resolvase [Kytococcus aerolatus]|uniref:Putative pre-16S rRNA nuclease n=1 Tax=Kytococcus aerolatus TaxID=592308 RepID=A0A212T099_9MICO|nr:Holliday junction resolvase RuvX [Kytococcus aerolatus]SNC59194.1 putative holliday junction resolvase [Kytococcus aerolatus]